MKTNRPSRLKVLLTAVVVSGALVFGGAGRAHAFVDPITIYAATMLGVIAIAGTYVAAKATVCTPVAAVKASDHAAGFGGAFKDCWDWSPISKQPGSAGTGGSEQPARPVEGISAGGSWPQE
ncbi:MAG: hypothetical protein A3F90_12910 [Deltaproteobacteria bacterium RIFCSPLOWO2_12_FULL_60_19]|nr:MAG: hypothetical protein A3F90_12910 [Deltaproteobacteria bacterium RIFCSPLOWO2_12_FULL_60_19]